MQVRHQFGILRIVIEREGHSFIGKRMGVNGEEARQVTLPYSQERASEKRRGKDQTVRAGFGHVTGAWQKDFCDQEAGILGMLILGDQQNATCFGRKFDLLSKRRARHMP
jgi:hypothetical protein